MRCHCRGEGWLTYATARACLELCAKAGKGAGTEVKLIAFMLDKEIRFPLRR